MAFFNDLTGTLLDRRYRITGLLGKGGMGHVYGAVHVALEQKVAIKVLHPRYATEERFRERFIREARSASKIQHRNVVRITDFGDTPDGSVYFVMELLEGHDVGEELRKVGPMPWPRTRHILMQAVGALRAAHAKDIIHRDIKPANCFLTVDKEEGVVDFVKLLDFGIAKVGSDSHTDAQGKGLTGTGEVFGTASYMAPEQARGGELDARSDMYSLGIMAYEMLTGRVPFTGVNSIHVITKHMSEAPAPLREHEPSVPAAVEALVLKMIAKEASQRYESMGALEHALRSIPESAGQPVRRTHVWGGTGKPGGKPAIASGTLASKTEPPVGKAVVAGPAKPTGKTVERTAVVPPRAAAGAVGQKRSFVGAGRRDASVPSPSPRAPVPPASPVGVGTPAAVAVARPLAGGRDPSVPPPGAVTQVVTGARDHSMPPAGAVGHAMHGGPAASVPPPGAVTQVVTGARDHSMPPPGAVAHPVGGSHDHSAPRGAVAHAVPASQDRSVPPGAMGPSIPGSQDRSVPPPGAMGRTVSVVPPSVAEGTNPPPGGRDRSVPPPSAWSSSASSTGPLARVGDSSAETSPQSLQMTQPPAITGRMIAVVVGLVILVGAGSAVGTMVFLSSREVVEPAAAAAEPVPVVPAQEVVLEAKEAPVEPTKPAGEEHEPEVEEAMGVASTGMQGIQADTADEGTTADGEVAGTTGDDSSSSDEPGFTSTNIEDDGNEADTAPTKPSEGSAAASKEAPKRPMHETAECKEVRDDAAAAHKTMQWKTLQGLTRKAGCWSDAGKAQRVRWHVMSLYELERYSECIKAGGSSKDAEVQGMVAVCKKKKESAK